MNIRQLKQEEVSDALAMSEFAFQYVLAPERREEVLATMKPERMWAIFMEGQMASKLTIYPFEVWLHGTRMQMGGVASVVTWPEYRRRGFVGQLLTHALRVMKEQGQVLSYLHPFSFSFYRKYGWETLSERRKYEIELGKLPQFPVYPGTIRRMTDDWSQARSVYEKCGNRYNAMLARDDERWDKRKKDHPNAVMAVYFDANDDPKGYIHFHVKDHVFEVHEMMSLDHEAYTALWRFIADHDSMLQVVKWTAPIDDALPFLLANPCIKQEIESYFMARIVDVAALFGQYPWQRDDRGSNAGTLIAVTDPYAPWNNGLFSLRQTDNGRTSVTVEDEADLTVPEAEVVRCDIQTLTAMMTGYKRPAFMRQIGRLHGSDEQVARLERWIPAATTFFPDFF